MLCFCLSSRDFVARHGLNFVIFLQAHVCVDVVFKCDIDM